MIVGGLVVLQTLLDLAVLTAVGLRARPTCWRRAIARMACFAPIAGLAIASAVLTTFAVVMPMRIAAYAVLVLMALNPHPASSCGTDSPERAKRPKRGLGRSLGSSAPLPAAVAMASAPAFARGTKGPMSLDIYDAWGVHQHGPASSRTTPFAICHPAAPRAPT